MRCNICPRNCNIERDKEQTGYCGQSFSVRLARAALHFFEEPCISGEEGSGAVFFSGCNMRCIFCQNHDIANGKIGADVSVERLSDIFLELQNKGANNINLVTPTHYALQIREALIRSKDAGLRIPVVYNTSAYEKTETLKLLEGLIDVYLPDFKYMQEELAYRYSGAIDYSKRADDAIFEMLRQVGEPVFNERGIMEKGVIVRHLVLPGCINNSKRVIEHLLKTYGNRIYISIMNQYTPMENVELPDELHRKVTRREYEKVVDYAIELGIENGFIQEGKTQEESFIPEFNLEGV